MKLGFIKPNYPNEKRVALLPEHIIDFENDLIIESGFGEYLDISDNEYIAKGCKIKSRDEIFLECETIFNLKLIQPSDYVNIRKHQMIIGWTHPTGSGTDFMKFQAIPKELVIADLDNIYPTIFFKEKKIPITFVKQNFIWKNSFLAGFSSTLHAILSMGFIPNSNSRIAILGTGNVAQGAFTAISRFNCEIRLFYRKTMDLFYESIGDFDIIINGIEIDVDNAHIITKQDLQKIKNGCLILDAAADAGRAIEGTKYTSIANPIYIEDLKYFYEVNNSPSIFYREASEIISSVFSEWIYKKDVRRFWDLIK
jgi:N5-(carboxyethyl)ornithine synthase